MNKEQLAEKAKEYAGSVDNARWALSELALEAKREDIDGWAAIIGHVVRRSDRTVREWAQVADFRQALGVAISLPYSFYARAMRAVTKLKTEKIVELLDTAAAEGVTLEAFSALLDELCKADEEEPEEDEPMEEPELTLAQQWRAIAARLTEQAEGQPEWIAQYLGSAALDLENAARVWEHQNSTAETPPQENFYDAVRADPEMSPEHKAKWLAMEPASSMEDALAADLIQATNEMNANGDGTMEASLYHRGRLVAGPGR